MKKYLIGNWKSNKTAGEVEIFFNALKTESTKHKAKIPDAMETVICPTFIHRAQAKKLIKFHNLPVKLGAQDVSPYGSGAYTGEVFAGQLKQLVDYIIVGHSERRKYFHETPDQLLLKVNEAKKSGLKVIYCAPDNITPVPENVDIVAYEPVFAIGTGVSDTPQNANKTISEIKGKYGIKNVIYGGSVTAENIREFLKQKSIDGVLPGKSSLDADQYFRMLTNAAT